MASSVAPEALIAWVPEGEPTSGLIPSLSVCDCEALAGLEFFKQVFNVAVGQQLNWNEFRYVVCCATARVEKVELNPRYIVNGTVNMDLLTTDVINEMTRQGDFVADHSQSLSTVHRRVFSAWRKLAARNSVYRWRLLVDVRMIDTGDNYYGVEFSTFVAAQKLLGSSGRWDNMPQLAVYNLGNEMHASMLENRKGEQHARIGAKSSDDDHVVKISRDVSLRLAKLVSKGASNARLPVAE
jgi:hypothetical protein